MKLSTYIIFAIVIILLITLSVISWYYFATIKIPASTDNSTEERLKGLSVASGFILSIFSLIAIVLFIANIEDDYYERKKQKTSNLPQNSEQINLSGMDEKSKTE